MFGFNSSMQVCINDTSPCNCDFLFYCDLTYIWISLGGRRSNRSNGSHWSVVRLVENGRRGLNQARSLHHCWLHYLIKNNTKIINAIGNIFTKFFVVYICDGKCIKLRTFDPVRVIKQQEVM